MARRGERIPEMFASACKALPVSMWNYLHSCCGLRYGRLTTVVVDARPHRDEGVCPSLVLAPIVSDTWR